MIFFDYAGAPRWCERRAKQPIGEGFRAHQCACAFKEFFEWCDNTSQNLGRDIKTGKKSQAKLIAKITKKTGDIEVSTSKIEELAAALTTNEGALKDAKAIHDNEDADFAASEQELMATVVTIDHAVVGRVSSEIN